MAKKRDIVIKKRKTARKAETSAETTDTTAEESPRRRRRHGRSLLWVLFTRLLVVAVLLLLVVAVWKNWDTIAPSTVLDWINAKVTGGDAGDGYPLSITGNSVVDMASAESNVVLVTDTSMLMYNANGAQVMNRSHTFANPLLETAGSYLLVADIGGTRFQLGTRKETVFEKQTAYPLLSAAVGAGGHVAVVTESGQSYTSEMIVYDKKGKEQFHWYSSELTAVGTAISADGKHAAVLGLSAEGGRMRSTLLVFDVAGGQKEAVASYSAVDVMMCAAAFDENGRVLAVGDTAAWIYDVETKTCQVQDYSDQELLGYAFGKTGMVLVTHRYGSGNNGEWTLLGGGSPVTGTLSGSYRHVSAAKDAFYLLTSDTVTALTAAGETGQTDVKGDGLLVASLDGQPLVLGLTTLTQYPLQG